MAHRMDAIDVDAWCESQLRLLEMEREAEVQEKARLLDSKVTDPMHQQHRPQPYTIYILAGSLSH